MPSRAQEYHLPLRVTSRPQILKISRFSHKASSSLGKRNRKYDASFQLSCTSLPLPQTSNMHGYAQFVLVKLQTRREAFLVYGAYNSNLVHAMFFGFICPVPVRRVD
jgi:hypothetical protein